MRSVDVRFRFSALIFSLVLTIVCVSPALGQNILAQYALGGATGETSDPAVKNVGRSGTGYEASISDVNVTAGNVSISDSIPPSAEEYIEITSPSYVDANGNDFPVLRLEPGSNSNTPAEAVTKDKYFSFTVTPAAGFLLNLTSLQFDAGRGGSATPRGYVVLSDVDGFTNFVDQQDVPTVRPDQTHFTIDLSGAQYQGLSEVTFRIYTYLPGGGRSIEYSNVTLYGTAQ